MTYYEEFGVQPTATAGQIHQAYKMLVRLLHPDSQTDQELKAVAELQMRRLNGMLETLLDPERRRAYDESLGGNRAVRLPPARLYHARPVGVWPGVAQAAVRHWFWVLTGLVVVGAAIWYAAMRDSAMAEVAGMPGPAASGRNSSVPSSPKPAPYPAQAPVATATATERAPENVRRDAAPVAVGGPAAGVPSPDLPPVESGSAIEDGGVSSVAPMDPPSAVSPRPAPIRATGETESPQTAVRRPDTSSPWQKWGQSAAANDSKELNSAAWDTPRPSPRAASESQSSWAGSWLYVPRQEDAAEVGLYAPSYIEFLLVEDHGNLTGNYRARYSVLDRALSPEVGFRAEGKAPSGNRAQLAWASDAGARGAVELVLGSADRMKVTWWTTTFGRDAGLTSGTATLVRQRTR